MSDRDKWRFDEIARRLDRLDKRLDDIMKALDSRNSNSMRNLRTDMLQAEDKIRALDARIFELERRPS